MKADMHACMKFLQFVAFKGVLQLSKVNQAWVWRQLVTTSLQWLPIWIFALHNRNRAEGTDKDSNHS